MLFTQIFLCDINFCLGLPETCLTGIELLRHQTFFDLTGILGDHSGCCTVPGPHFWVGRAEVRQDVGGRCQLQQVQEKWHILGNVFRVIKDAWVDGVRSKEKWHITYYPSQMAYSWPQVLGVTVSQGGGGEHRSVGGWCQ